MKRYTTDLEVEIVEISEVIMRFTVREIAGTCHDGSLVYTRPDFDVTTDPAEAAVFASGQLKWDGCMDLNPQDLWHFCSLADAMNVRDLLALLYGLGAEHIEKWNPQ